MPKGKGKQNNGQNPKSKGKGNGNTGKGKTESIPSWVAEAQNVLPTPPPVPQVVPSTAEVTLSKLVAQLKNNPEQMTEEVQRIVKEASATETKNATKKMHAAVADYGRRKDSYGLALQARGRCHAAWKAFILQSIQTWQRYTTEFQEEDSKLTAEINAAKEALSTARKTLETWKDNVGLEGMSLDGVSLEEDDASGSAAAMIVDNLHGMTEMLTTLKTKADEWEEEQDKKRARTSRTEGEESAEPNAAVDSQNGSPFAAGQLPGAKALQPFA